MEDVASGSQTTKAKKPRTPAQMEATARMLQAMAEKRKADWEKKKATVVEDTKKKLDALAPAKPSESKSESSCHRQVKQAELRSDESQPKQVEQAQLRPVIPPSNELDTSVLASLREQIKNELKQELLKSESKSESESSRQRRVKQAELCSDESKPVKAKRAPAKRTSNKEPVKEYTEPAKQVAVPRESFSWPNTRPSPSHINPQRGLTPEELLDKLFFK